MATLTAEAANSFAAQALSSPGALAAVLDHTLLKPEATPAQVLQLCEEAATFRFACAMVNPCWVSLAAEALRGSGIRIGVVVGFPLGANLTRTKLDETRQVLAAGALDIDMVLNIGFLKSGMDAQAAEEIAQLAALTHQHGAILKVILETALLSDEEKSRASHLAVDAGADFIKTSTGFSTGGATVQDIATMRGIAGTRCGVKASGGIRTLQDTVAMLNAGATRIGASASIRIVQQLTGDASPDTRTTGY